MVYCGIIPPMNTERLPGVASWMVINLIRLMMIAGLAINVYEAWNNFNMSEVLDVVAFGVATLAVLNPLGTLSWAISIMSPGKDRS